MFTIMRTSNFLVIYYLSSSCHHNLLNDSYPRNPYISGKHAILPSRNPIEGNLIAFILGHFHRFMFETHYSDFVYFIA